jgi:hypothetical protein
MSDSWLTTTVGASFLLIGIAKKRKKIPDGNAFFVIGLGMIILTIFLNLLVRLF